MRVVVEAFLDPKKNIPPGMTKATECAEKWLPWVNHIWRNCRIETIREYSLLRYAGPMDTSNPEQEFIINKICALIEDKING